MEKELKQDSSLAVCLDQQRAMSLMGMASVELAARIRSLHCCVDHESVGIYDASLLASFYIFTTDLLELSRKC